MTTKFVSLPLYSDPFYTYAVSLQGVSYILEFIYNERTELYSLSLYDQNNNPIVLGEALVPNYPMFKDYAIFPLTGFFWMEEISDILSEPYKVFPDSINQYYKLSYIYEEV